jgi:hypothetical protein
MFASVPAEKLILFHLPSKHKLPHRRFSGVPMSTCCFLIPAHLSLFYGYVWRVPHSLLSNRNEPMVDNPYLSGQAGDLISQILSEEFWHKFVSLYVQEGHAHEIYLPSIMNFFYRLFKLFHAQLFDPTKASFTPLCSSKDTWEQRLASEWFAGLLKSTKSWTLSEVRDLETDMQGILDAIIDHIGPYSLGNWLIAFEDGTVSLDDYYSLWVQFYSRPVINIKLNNGTYVVIFFFVFFFLFT